MATSRTGTGHWKNQTRRVRQQAQDQGLTHCPSCGIWLDWEHSRRPNSPEVDHITPHTLGGTNHLDNLQIICRRCNQSKGGRAAAKKPMKNQRINHTINPDTQVSW